MGKTCKFCSVEKSITEFTTYNNGYGTRVRSRCKDCRNTLTRGTRKEASQRYYSSNTEKLREKKLKYYKENQSKLQEYSTTYYRNNREIISLKVAAKTYGITTEEVKSLRESACNICGSDGSEYKKSLHIDHCHITGTVRGTLCQSCNIALGLFKDNTHLLDKAKEYLVEFTKS